MTRDLKDGARAVRVLSKEVKETRRLQAEVARAILDKARSNAASHPTPQSRMVAAGMIVRRGVVIGAANRLLLGGGSTQPVKLGHLAYGAEFGSNTERQFGPRRESGYWLHPAAEKPNSGIDKAEESFLDRVIATAIRAAGI